MSRTRAVIAIAVVGACLLAAAATWAAETLTVTASFSPDKLGVPTNVTGSATIVAATGGLPSPMVSATVMGPPGIAVNVEGVGVCNPAKLQARGPEGCPADSKAGYGGGLGESVLGGETIKEPFTLNFFRGPNEDGHIVLLAYVDAVKPISVQLVLKAQVVHWPKPYGLGFTFKVPLVETVPGAPDASVTSIFITLGDSNVAYYEKVHGRRELVHVKGIIVPKTCPPGGFPYETRFGFEDGSTSEADGTIPCPSG